METYPEPDNIIDISVKALFRECPVAILRLAGIDIDPAMVRMEDANINLPELRADHVFILPADDGQEKALYLEYQLVPDANILPSWFAKCGGLTRQLGVPVAFMALYLQRGDRATFHDRYSVSVGGVTTQFVFTTIRLWEYADRIRSGEMAELAPLLILCDDSPSEQTAQQEIALIRGADLPDDVKADLLSLALRIASRRLSRQRVLTIFREEIPMIQETGIIEEWLDAREMQGRIREARAMLLRLGSQRFGDADEQIQSSMEAIMELETLEELLDRLLKVESWQELLSPVEGIGPG